MPKIAASPMSPARNLPIEDEIRAELRSILASPSFHGSKRCQQFLEYVCEKSLSGGAATLKERTVAVEVFGRRPQSDLGDDTIVRVSAREVRKRLVQFYASPQGAASLVHIDLVSGSYVPEFRYAGATREPAHPPIAVPVDPPRRQPSHARIVIAATVVLLVAVTLFGVTKWTAGAPPTERFRRFWEPVFATPEPLLLAVANPLVYHASARATRISEAHLPPLRIPMQRPIQVPPDELDGSDLIPVQNQYVGFGDMVVATDVAAMLARNSKSVRVRLASSVQFDDLRQSQTLLIGAVTNRWTMELGQTWRFQFMFTPGTSTTITDTLKTGRHWGIPAKEDGSTPEDYLLISRIRNSSTGGLLIVAAGVKQFGTEAAGRLLTDPVQFSAVLGGLPHGWEDRNLQIVLHAQVIGNTPAQPEVVAFHVW
jgi:hypothetical protein